MKEYLKKGENLNEGDKAYPVSVGQAVQYLLYNLSFRDKLQVAIKTEPQLPKLQNTLGTYIQREFGLDGNMSLIESCLLHSDNRVISSEDASQIIIKEFWKQLKATRS